MFKVGDNVIVISPHPLAGLTGFIREYVPKGSNLSIARKIVCWDVPKGFIVGLGDNDSLFAEPHELRKLDDGNDSSSWDAIQKITNWNPTRETVDL